MFERQRRVRQLRLVALEDDPQGNPGRVHIQPVRELPIEYGIFPRQGPLLALNALEVLRKGVGDVGLQRRQGLIGLHAFHESLGRIRGVVLVVGARDDQEVERLDRVATVVADCLVVKISLTCLGRLLLDRRQFRGGTHPAGAGPVFLVQDLADPLRERERATLVLEPGALEHTRREPLAILAGLGGQGIEALPRRARLARPMRRCAQVGCCQLRLLDQRWSDLLTMGISFPANDRTCSRIDASRSRRLNGGCSTSMKC